MLTRANEHETKWNELVEEYAKANPELGEAFKQAISNELPEDYAKDLPVYEAGNSSATRADSGDIIQALSKSVPAFFGGSADLASSNKSNVKDEPDFNDETPEGRNIWFGVREFGMAAAVNGMAAHGALLVTVAAIILSIIINCE